MARRSTPRAKKSLGQHFLRDQSVLDAIAAAVSAPVDSLVVEVGPGTGQLTAALLARGYNVTAIERDRRMVEHLANRFRDSSRLNVIEGDVRDIETSDFVTDSQPYTVVGNLPYFIASPIVRHFLEQPAPPTEIVVMVQREVGREMAASEGKRSMLSVGIQTFGAVESLFDVPPAAFDPPPKVHSSVVRIVPHETPLVPSLVQPKFFRIVRGAFRHSRKQVHNALVRGAPYDQDAVDEALAAAHVDHIRRPETLSIAEWLALVDALPESP